MRSIDLSTKQQVAIIAMKLLAIISVSFAIGLKAGESRWKTIAKRAIDIQEETEAGWERSQVGLERAIEQIILERKYWMAEIARLEISNADIGRRSDEERKFAPALRFPYGR